jgi:hypothetical protein
MTSLSLDPITSSSAPWSSTPSLPALYQLARADWLPTLSPRPLRPRELRAWRGCTHTCTAATSASSSAAVGVAFAVNVGCGTLSACVAHSQPLCPFSPHWGTPSSRRVHREYHARPHSSVPLAALTLPTLRMRLPVGMPHLSHAHDAKVKGWCRDGVKDQRGNATSWAYRQSLRPYFGSRLPVRAPILLSATSDLERAYKWRADCGGSSDS